MAAFYDLAEEERIALTEKAMAEGRTVYERWSVLASAEATPWSARAALAADFLGEIRSIVDLGCGTMNLERHLKEGIAYYPVDVVARDLRTIVCDLNVEHPPILDAEAVACLGVFEYILEPKVIIDFLANNYSMAVFSYCITDAASPMESRRSHAWVNDFSKNEIETIFNDCGWKIERYEPIDGFQSMWRLSSSERV